MSTVQADLVQVRDLFTARGFTVTKDRSGGPVGGSTGPYIEAKKRKMGTARVMFEQNEFLLKLYTTAPGWGSMWRTMKQSANVNDIMEYVDNATLEAA